MSDTNEGASRPPQNPAAETSFEVIANILIVGAVGYFLFDLAVWQAALGAFLLYSGSILHGRGQGFGYFRATMAEADEHAQWLAAAQLAAMRRAAEAAKDEEPPYPDPPEDVLRGRGDSRDDG